MRVISQKGTYDLPYELTSFCVDRSTLEIQAIVNGNFELNMAKYSSLDRCVKAMDMLQDAYASNFMYSTMTQNERALYLESIGEENHLLLMGVFRFPSEKEIGRS